MIALLFLSLSAFNPPLPDSAQANTASTEQILPHVRQCSPSLSLRSQALNSEQENAICSQLGQIEAHFFKVFGQSNQAPNPVAHDHNQSLRANIYKDKQSFMHYAGEHFHMPTNNGGMYLEGAPDQAGNQAEFIAYQRDNGEVHNLGHEYLHYLDGRYNLYGDFCANLHDSHAPPENCPRPEPEPPYLVWWTEGIAEYLSHPNGHPATQNLAQQNTYRLSELFYTGYEKNNDSTRIYSWGYLATRFMMEKHRDAIEQMLVFTRVGDYPRYQALVRSWDKKWDVEFELWRVSLSL